MPPVSRRAPAPQSAKAPEAPRTANRHAFAALGCFVLTALALVGPAVLGRNALGPESLLDRDPLYQIGAAPPPPDTSDFTPITIDLPRDLAMARGIRAGRLDAWNPLVGFGAPLWAEQGGPFFPLKLPFYLAPSPQSYTLFLGLRLVVAAFGAYLLARQRGLRPTLALAAGMLFELSGALVTHLAFAAASPIYVLSWVLLGAEILADRGRLTVAALGLGIAGLGGHPTEILMVFAAFGAAIAGHLIAAWPRSPVMGAIALRGALAVLLGLAVAAPSLLPLAELARVATFYRLRGWGDLTWWIFLEQSRETLPVSLFAPSLLALMQHDLHSVFPWALGPTIGILGLLAALTGVLRRGLDAPLIAVALLGIGLTTVPPGFGWLHSLPGMTLILPRYAWVLVVLPMTQAAGSGIEALELRDYRHLLMALILLLVGFASLAFVQDGWPFHYRTALDHVLASTQGRLRLLIPPILAIACAAIALIMRPRGSTFYAVVAVLEAYIIVAPYCLLPASVVLHSPPSPAVQFLQDRLADGEGRMLAVPSAVGQPFTPALFGLADVRGFFALPFRRYFAYLDIMTPAAPVDVQQRVGVMRSPLLDLGAVRYVVVRRTRAPAAFLDKDAELPLAYADEHVAVYENRAAVPRVRLVHRSIRVADEENAHAWLAERANRSAHADGGDLKTTVVVEPDEDGRLCPELGSGSEGDSVRVVETRDPDRMVVRVKVASSALLVIADSYCPGWRARIDGHPASIFPADLLFRAVFVPAGEHEIVLTYAPHSLVVGALLCVLGVAGSLVALRYPSRTASPAKIGQTQLLPVDRSC